MARKINYTGDWLMGLAWCMCCGGITPIAYFYAIYFAVRPPPPRPPTIAVAVAVTVAVAVAVAVWP